MTELLEHLKHGPFDPSKRRRAKRRRARHNTEATTAATPSQENNNDAEPKRQKLVLLNKKQVLAKIPVSPPTLWAWVRAGKFPEPRAFGPNKSLWFEHEVDAAMMALPIRKYKP
jgi:predicted DNA-binding transcriptional regulator AlpA